MEAIEALRRTLPAVLRQFGDDVLTHNDGVEMILKQYKVHALHFDATKTDVSIAQERITLENAPSNFIFISGHEYDVITYTNSIGGAHSAVGKLFPNSNERYGLTVRGSVVSYREASVVPLAGDAEARNHIKEKAKAAFQRISDRIEQYNQEAIATNEQMKTEIARAIEVEKTRRKNEKDTLNDMKF